MSYEQNYTVSNAVNNTLNIVIFAQTYSESTLGPLISHFFLKLLIMTGSVNSLKQIINQ